jgi:DNA-binding CsgD family transcriptional regulator
MTYPSERDLSNLVVSLYEASHTSTLMGPALEQIRSTFGFQAYHQFVLDGPPGPPTQEWSNDHISADDMAVYAEHYFKVDPRASFSEKLGVGQPFCTNDFISPQERAHSELYQDFLIPRGMGDCVGAQLMATDQTKAFAAFLDRPDHEASSPQRRQHLAFLIPHLSKSVQLLMKMQGLKEQLHASTSAMDDLEPAVITLNSRYKSITVNRRAENLLRLKRYLRVDRDILSTDAQNSPLSFASLLQRVMTTGIPESRALFGGAPVTMAHLNVSRVFNAFELGQNSGASLLLILTEPNSHRVATVKQLMHLFNATPAEARLARALAHGVEPTVYAEENSIKISTVRTQISSVMKKAQVSRLTDLIRMVLTIPAMR